MTTQQILQKIREVNPELLELSFGCEVKPSDSNETAIFISKDSYYHGGGFRLFDSKRVSLKALGHPPQLNHLFRAIGDSIISCENIDCENLKFYIGGDNAVLYNLTKTVEQNLDESEELRKFLSELLK